MNGKQIKQAAETMEALADSLEAEQAKTVKLAQENEQLRAQVAQKKTASEETLAKRTALAKRASAALLQSGMITTPERAESFAQEIVDPDKAIFALHKFAEHSAAATKTASVVDDPQGSVAPQSSDDVWDSHARQFLPQGA
jgi:hypothetical protein